MRKLYSIIFFVLALLSTISAQDIMVLKKWGAPKILGNEIKTGDEIQLLSSITFSKDERLLLVNHEGNLFWSEAPEGATFQLKNTLIEIPVKPTRGFIAKYSGITDFNDYFGSRTFTMIDDTLEIPVDLKSFPLNNAHFLVFYYKLNDSVIAKKIGFDNQKLILAKNALLQAENQIIASDFIPKIEIYEYFPNTGQSNFITKVNFQFTDKNILMNEINKLANYVSTDPEKKALIIDNYLDIVYGKFDGIQKMEIKNLIKESIEP